MAKDYNDSDGRWVTISGRKVFIAEGQSLGDAMKKSGKFKNVKEVKSSRKNNFKDGIPQKDKNEFLMGYGLSKDLAKGYAKERQDEKEKRMIPGEKINATMDKRQAIIEKLDKDTKDLNEYDRYNLAVSKLEQSDKMQPTERQYWAGIRDRYQKNALGKQMKNEEKDYKVEEHNLSKDLFGKEAENRMSQKQKDYANETYPRASGGTKFEDMGLDVEDKKGFSDYLRNKYGTDDFRIINFENKEGAKKIYDEFKKSSNESSKYASAKRIGFGDYNKDDVPVYQNKIDYTGDFSKAKLSTLSNEELTQALNKQSELYNKAVKEKLGDQRTRNGRMNKIFNTANKQQYENGMQRLNEEMHTRNLPRYEITNKDNGMVMVSSPTKEMAERQLKEIQEIDKSLQKSYGWKKLPEYELKEGKSESPKPTKRENPSNNFDMRKYDVQVKHDNGISTISVVASDENSARKMVMKSENAPESSIRKVKDNGSILNKSMNESIREKAGKTKADRNIDAFDDDNKKESQRRLNAKYDYNTPGKIGNMKTEDFVKQRNEFNAKADKLWNDNKVDSKQKKISDDAKSGKISKQEAYKRIFNLHDDNFKQLNQISKNYDDEVVASKKPMYSERSNVIKRAMARMSDENKAKTRDAREELRKELNESGFGKSIKNAVKENKMFKEWQRYRKSHPNSDISLTSFKQKYKG